MHQSGQEFLVGTEDNGRRVDKILRIALPELSLSLIHRLLRTGKIRLNDQKTSAAERVAPA